MHRSIDRAASTVRVSPTTGHAGCGGGPADTLIDPRVVVVPLAVVLGGGASVMAIVLLVPSVTAPVERGGWQVSGPAATVTAMRSGQTGAPPVRRVTQRTPFSCSLPCSWLTSSVALGGQVKNGLSSGGAVVAPDASRNAANTSDMAIAFPNTGGPNAPGLRSVIRVWRRPCPGKVRQWPGTTHTAPLFRQVSAFNRKNGEIAQMA